MMQHIRIEEENAFRQFFGKRLLTARRAANLSQKGLAKRLGTGQDTISNYERGKVIPNILTLFQIAQILCVNVNYFFPEERFSILSSEDRETLALISSLSPITYDFLLILIQALASQRLLPIHRIKPNPTKALERFLEGKMPHPFLNKTKPSMYVLIGIIVVCLDMLEGDASDSNNSTLFEKCATNAQLWINLIHELQKSE